MRIFLVKKKKVILHAGDCVTNFPPPERAEPVVPAYIKTLLKFNLKNPIKYKTQI